MGFLLGGAIPFLELVGRQSVPGPENVYQSTIEIVKGHQDAARSIRIVDDYRASDTRNRASRSSIPLIWREFVEALGHYFSSG
jgi:hypothetical protein